VCVLGSFENCAKNFFEGRFLGWVGKSLILLEKVGRVNVEKFFGWRSSFGLVLL